MYYKIYKGLANIFLRLVYRVKAYGVENVPFDGKFILCGNHANNLDPIFISMVVPRQISWMGKKELFENKLLALILSSAYVFPVDRHQSDVSAIKNALRVLKNDKVLGIFPEGTRVNKMNLEDAKPGVALLAIKSKSPVLPVYIESNYKFFNRVNIYIGEPMEIHTENGVRLSTDDYIEKSVEILKTVYGLKNK